MKDLLLQTIVYYIAAPVILALWPLLLWLYYLPHAASVSKIEQKIYTEARQLAEQILTLDPERRTYDDEKKTTGFDYTVAINAAAKKLGISSKNYTVSSKPLQKSKDQKTRDCQVTINEIDITNFAKFLSNLQLTWANLQCQKVTLTKKQDLPDAWKVDLTLKYYY
jgi:hypothetical protein